MLQVDKINVIKAMLSPETVGNDTLLPYLELAESIILNRLYPYKDNSGLTVPPQYDMVVCQATVELYNKRGAEGQASHSENAISRTWTNTTISPSLLKLVTPFVGSVTVAEE